MYVCINIYTHNTHADTYIHTKAILLPEHVQFGIIFCAYTQKHICYIYITKIAKNNCDLFFVHQK